QAQLVAAAIQIAHVVDQIINRIGGQIVVSMKNQLCLAVAKMKAGDVRIMTNDFEAQHVAIIVDRALELGHAEDEAVDSFEHQTLMAASAETLGTSLSSSSFSFSVGA